MFLVVRIIDVVWDPMVGAIVDKSHPRWGKYRSWLILGAVLLFADYIDFLAYESLHGQIFKEIPDWSDVLILNQVTNLNAWLETIGNENYDHIYLLLPLSTAGRTLSKTIEELYKSSVRNCSNIYSCFPRLTDFARHKDTMLNASKIKL